MTANQGKITTMGGTTGLVDQTDKMHTGILKVLETFNKGDTCIGHAGFTITGAGTYTQYNLLQPIHFTTQGDYKTYGTNISIAYTNSLVGTQTQNANYTRYDLVSLVPTNTPTLVITLGTFNGVNGLVPDIPAGNIPIALIEVTAGTDPDKTDYNFQLYTLDKQSNSLSVGYSSSANYYETLQVGGSNAGTYMKNVLSTLHIESVGDLNLTSGDDMTITLGDNASTSKFTINNLAGQEQFGVTGAGVISLHALPAVTMATDDKIIVRDTNSADALSTIAVSAVIAASPQGTVTSVSAGTGMTQTGTSTVNPTLNVIGGAGITANADEILITDAGVTMAKLANIATDTFIGRTDANAGVPKALSKTEALEILNVTDGASISSVVAGTGLTGGATTGAATLNVIGGDGITANANEIEVAVDDSTIELSATSGTGAIRVKDGGIVVGKMAANSVDSAQYVNGSIDNEHLASGINSDKIADGSVTNAEFQHINTLSSNAQTQLNSKLKQGLHTIWVPSEAMTPRGNAGCGALAATAAGNTDQPDFRALPFDTSTQEHAQFSIAMPKMWDEASVQVKFYWTSTSSSTSQTCFWGIRAVACSNDDALAATFGSVVGSADTNLGAKKLCILGLDTALSINGTPAAGDLCFFEVTRVVGSDNLATDALLLGVKLLYNINAENDA